MIDSFQDNEKERKIRSTELVAYEAMINLYNASYNSTTIISRNQNLRDRYKGTVYEEEFLSEKHPDIPIGEIDSARKYVFRAINICINNDEPPEFFDKLITLCSATVDQSIKQRLILEGLKTAQEEFLNPKGYRR